MFNACSQRPLRTRYCEAFARRALDPVRHKKRKRTLWEDFCAKPVPVGRNNIYGHMDSIDVNSRGTSVDRGRGCVHVLRT